MRFRSAARCAGAAILAAVAGAALAQAGYPNRPVRIVVPSSPGGGTDILTRLLTPQLTERLHQQVVVDNRPGAGSIIGNELVSRAAPDGYTLLMGISTLAILPSMHKKLPYDALRDLAPITQAIAAPNVLVVHPSLPVRSVKELIAFARKRPGDLSYASAGLGTNPHLCMELFLNMAQVKMVHVPYKGLGPAIIDLVAGHVVVATATMLTGLPQIRSGRLRGLGVTGSARSSVLPDLPTIAEAGVPGYEAGQWYGLFAPARTPANIISQLHAAMAGALKASAIREKMASDGVQPVGSTPDEFARFMRAETDKWGKVARAAGIVPQ
jgi:tripartite-type tricarboxylate transporter receptor subunit TctC